MTVALPPAVLCLLFEFICGSKNEIKAGGKDTGSVVDGPG